MFSFRQSVEWRWDDSGVTGRVQRARSPPLLTEDLMHFFMLWRHTGLALEWKADHGRSPGHRQDNWHNGHPALKHCSCPTVHKAINIPRPGDTQGEWTRWNDMSFWWQPSRTRIREIAMRWTLTDTDGHSSRVVTLIGPSRKQRWIPHSPLKNTGHYGPPDPVIDHSIKGTRDTTGVDFDGTIVV